MKKTLAILMLIGSYLLLLMFLILSVVMLTEFHISTFIFVMIIILIPGLLLLFGSTKMLKELNKPTVYHPAQNINEQSIHSATGPSFDPFDDNSRIEQTLNGSMTQTVGTVANNPVFIDFSGCGSKTTVYPSQSTNCDYCGTAVQYVE